ncbi:MAG TPA: hypothetical protein VF746_11975 [Longimicrobium sp.]|jgi:hypothetical protein
MTAMLHSRRPLRLAAALCLALLAACGGGDAGGAADDAPLPEGFTTLPASARVPVAQAAERRCNSPSSRSVFRQPIEWESFWGVNPGCTPPALPPGMDWQKEMLVLAAMGKRKSAQERIEIVGRGEKGDTLMVLVRRTTLVAGCPDEGAEVYPVSVVRIPQDERRVRFLEERRRIPCGG